MYTLLLLIGIGSVSGADIAMTASCISTQACTEANPIMRPLADHPAAFGAVKAGITVGAVLGIWKATARHPKARVVALLGVLALQAVVVGVNYSRLH